MASHWLGVDTGGTFTDFVYYDGQRLRIHKVLSTPRAPEQAILQGIEELQLDVRGLHLVHGSTVATNAVLEGKGVNTVYVTNRGFADVLSIGRQARSELYNLMPRPRAPLIPRSHCLEVDTRLSAEGELLQALNDADIEQLCQQVRELNADAVAINLLFSFLDPRQEQALKQALQADAQWQGFVCVSSQVLAEYREYERGMATALNAYVGPLMQGYLTRLENALNAEGVSSQTSSPEATPQGLASLSILQSSAGSIAAAQAAEHGVHLLLSGPAGGLKGAQQVAQLAGHSRLLSFDMGGTSTDVALIDGDIRLTSEASIAGYPVAVSMVDMHTIGAGGGSIATVDAGGLLNVGPQSAGADPGPACYGKGGQQPTVTDANLLLGRLRVDGFKSSSMQLDLAAARAAMQPLAELLGLSVEAAALGVIRIANEHMVRALRKISLERGHDPQEFVLACFGGAGGLHVCALADAMGMRQALVPTCGGVLSALGMLVAQPSRELSHSVLQPLQQLDEAQLESLFEQMQQQGMADMQRELSAPPQVSRSLDLRYQGQSFDLNLPWMPLAELQQAFHDLHQRTYGHALDMPVELVNLRLRLVGEAPPFALPRIDEPDHMAEPSRVECVGFDRPVPLYQREQLSAGQQIQGPALILEAVSTTLLAEHWQCRVDPYGNLLLQRT
jgi:N-methylhydantoinase A